MLRKEGAFFSLRSLLFASLLPAMLLPGATVSAETPGKVVEYGIYSKNNKLVKRTATIPAGGAVRFGFCFEADVQFFDDDSYMLVESLSHPTLDGQQGGENNGYSVPRMFKIRDGTAYGCSGYRARDASDLRPGVWRFVISDGPDELVVQEFEIK
jgi:hypothetical protein